MTYEEALKTIQEHVKRLDSDIDAYRESLMIRHDDAVRMRRERDAARALLSRAYAEIRKQVFGSKVVFDRDIVDLAKAAEIDDIAEKANEEWLADARVMKR